MSLPAWLNALHPFGPRGRWMTFALLCSLVVVGMMITQGTPEPSIRILSGHQYVIHAAVFSPDGVTLATGGGQPHSKHAAELKLWDVATGTERLTLSGHTGSVVGLAFSPDGTRLASVGDDQTLRLWDCATGQECAEFRANLSPGMVSRVVFSPAGDVLATASYDQGVRLWDVAGGQMRSLISDAGWNPALAFTTDGQRLATWGADTRAVKLWGLPTCTLRTTLGHSTDMSASCPPPRSRWTLAQGPAGLLAASASYTGGLTVERWDTDTQIGRVVWRSHLDWIIALTFSPDGELLAAGNWDGTVMIWETATGRERTTFNVHREPVTVLAFSADCRRIAAGYHDKTAILWELAQASFAR